MDDIPRIRKTLAILLPRIFPMAKSVLPLALAIIFTNSSGADVPKATMVKPMTRSDTFNRLAMDEAPSTKKYAPLIRNIKPIKNST